MFTLPVLKRSSAVLDYMDLIVPHKRDKKSAIRTNEALKTPHLTSTTPTPTPPPFPDPSTRHSPGCNVVIKLPGSPIRDQCFLSETDGSNKPLINFDFSTAYTAEQGEKQAPFSTVTVD